MSQITSSDVLDRAYEWLYAKRKTANSKNDFWTLCFSWPKVKRHLRHKLLSGNYHFSPLTLFISKDGQTISLYPLAIQLC